MIAWSAGKPPSEIKNNYICSPVQKQFHQGRRETGKNQDGAGWESDQHQMWGNCTAPTISLSPSGTHDQLVKVTISNGGLTHWSCPPGNTSIYSLRTGSIPTSASNLYALRGSECGETVQIQKVTCRGIGRAPPMQSAHYARRRKQTLADEPDSRRGFVIPMDKHERVDDRVT